MSIFLRLRDFVVFRFQICQNPHTRQAVAPSSTPTTATMDPGSATALAEMKAAQDLYQEWQSHQDQYHELQTPHDELRRLHKFRIAEK